MQLGLVQFGIEIPEGHIVTTTSNRRIVNATTAPSLGPPFIIELAPTIH